jgi:putative sigma-54 modulation protein
MNITFKALKTTIRDPFKEKVQKKLGKFDRFFEEGATAQVTVTNERERETVEVTINSNGLIFRAEKTTGDRLDSLDAVVDVLFKQIVKNKTKLETRMKAFAFDSIPEEPNEAENQPYALVKQKRFAVRPMDVDEAILQMNMLGHNFFLFENAATGELNVVYCRHGGDYGLIEPIR